MVQEVVPRIGGSGSRVRVSGLLGSQLLGFGVPFVVLLSHAHLVTGLRILRPGLR